jgi:hypothetical protein
MKLIGKIHPRRRHQAVRFVAKASLVFAILISCANATVVLYAATIAEVAAKIRSLKPQERTSYLLKGAQAEGELVYYGTLPIDEFLPLARVFNGRYRSIALQHYFSPRDGILSRTLTEARAGAPCGRRDSSGSELRLSVVECQSRAAASGRRREAFL